MENLGSISFSEEQADLLDIATNFCRDRSPVAKVRHLMEDDLGHVPAVWSELADLGWLGIAVPEDHGGVGLGLAEVVPVAEQIGRYLMAGPFASTTLAAQAIVKGGTAAQCAELLPAIAAGSPATMALVEESGDWNLEAVSCRLEGSGDTLTLSGRKILVQDAGAADVVIASVQYNGNPALVLIEKGRIPPQALRREVIIDETRRAFALTLDGITVPAVNLLDPARAQETLAHIHLVANLLAAAEMVGAAQSVIEYTLDYLRTRKQFGRLIGSYQALKHPIVDAYVLYEQARSHLYSAAHSFTEPKTGEIATRMAKVTAEKALSFAADRAIQFHGGFGFTYDCDAQLYRRKGIWHASQYGDAAYHRAKLASLLL